MDVITRVRARTGEVFYGWWMLAIGSALYFVGMGSVFYGFNVFFNPMVAEFGWSSAVTSGAYSLSRLEGGVQGLVVGPLIDKFGARLLMVVGFVLTGVGFLLLPLVQTPLSFYLIFGLLITMGYSTGCGLATTTLAANWFVQKRGRAMSILYAVGGFGGAAIVPTFGLLITHYGWREASIIIGVVMLVVGIPLSLLVKSRPEDKGLLPDGKVEVASSDTIPTAQHSELEKPSSRPDGRVEVDFTLREVIRTQAFWMYGIAFVLRVCILSTIVIHEMPHLINRGLTYEAAAGVLGAMILISVPGRLVFGWLGDRFDTGACCSTHA
ncbi:MAG: MFS transporter [Chloroflexota bacterium]|nr:MFS transporter [Chloroflexota bacterium]